MVGWLMVAGNAVRAGAVALGFAEYARRFIDLDDRVLALLLLAALTAILSASTRRWIWLMTALVVLEIAGLVLVIAAPSLAPRRSCPRTWRLIFD